MSSRADTSDEDGTVVIRRRRRREVVNKIADDSSHVKSTHGRRTLSEDAEVEQIFQRRPDSGISTDSESRHRRRGKEAARGNRDFLILQQLQGGAKSTSPEDCEILQSSTSSSRQRRRYASTGDLAHDAKKRILPDPHKQKTNIPSILSRIDGHLADAALESLPQLPTDRKLLEAQFNMLYKENIRLDQAYSELQDKVMEDNPKLLSSPRSNHQSPREIEWEVEKKRYLEEINYLKKERLAELEQSEATLRCQVLMLEDQLVETKSSLANFKEENDDLREECHKLSKALSTMDAEKAMLDDLKNQNSEFRQQLGQVEDEARQLATKLAEVVDEKSKLELEVCNLKHDMPGEGELKNLQNQNLKLRNEIESLKEQVSASQAIKQSLTEQLSTLEDEFNSVTKKFNNKIMDLNTKAETLQKEKLKLSEEKDHLEMEAELHKDMASKVNGRMVDLQNHIETLKSQLHDKSEQSASFEKLASEKLKLAQENSTLKEQIQKLIAENNDFVTKLGEIKDFKMEKPESEDFQENENFKELNESLKRQLEDTECLVVAHKNHLADVEEQNVNLKRNNDELRKQVGELKDKAVFLPQRQTLSDIFNELKLNKLAKTSPAKLNAPTEADEINLDTYSETETIAYENVLEELCTKVEKSEDTFETQKLKIIKLERDLIEREDQAKLQQRRIDMLDASCEELKLQLKLKEEQLLKIHEENLPRKQWEKFQKSMNEKLNDKEQLINDMTDRLQNLETILNQRSKEIEAFNDELIRRESDSKEMLRSKEEVIEKLTLNVADMNMALQNKSTEMESLRKINEEVKEREEEASENLKLSHEQIDAMTSAVNEVKHELKQKSEQLMTISQKAKKLEESWSNAEQSMCDKDCEINNLLNTMKCKEKEWSVELAEKDDKISELTDKYKQTVVLHTTVEAQDVRINELALEIKTLQEYSEQLKTERDDKEDSILMLTSRVDDMVKSEEILKSSLYETTAELEKSELEFQEKIKSIEENLKMNQKKVEASNMSNEELQSALHKGEEKIQELEEQIKLMGKEDKELNSHLDSLEVERELIKTSLANARDENQELAMRNEDLETNLTEMNNEINLLNENIESLNHQIDQLRNKVDKQNAEIESRDAEIEELMDENKVLTKQIDLNMQQLQEENQSLLNKSEEDLSSKTQHLTEENKRLSLAFNLVQDEHMRIKSELDNITMDKEDLEDEVYRLKSERTQSSKESLPAVEKNEGEDDVFRNVESNLHSNLEEELKTAREEKQKYYNQAVFLRSQNETLKEVLVGKSEDKRRNSDSSIYIPKLELGSIATESIIIAHKKRHSIDSEQTDFADDATEMDFEEIELGSISDIITPHAKISRMITRAGSFPAGNAALRASMKRLRARLKISEEETAKFKAMIQESEIEIDQLREDMGKRSKQSEVPQKAIDSVHENFQQQINHLKALNTTLKIQTEDNEHSIRELSLELDKAKVELENLRPWKPKYEQLFEEHQELLKKYEDLKEQLKNDDDTEEKVQDLTKLVEDLQTKIISAERENDELNGKLINMDMEMERILKDKNNVKTSDEDATINTPRDIKELPLDDDKELIRLFSSSSSGSDLIENMIKIEKRSTTSLSSSSSSSDGSDNEALDNSFGQPPPPIVETLAENLQALDDADEQQPPDDSLLMQTFGSSIVTTGEIENKDTKDGTQDVNDTGVGSSSDESAAMTSQGGMKIDLKQRIKDQEDEIMRLQLQVRKLEDYNKELLEGAGTIMTQDEKEAMEKELSTLRGQVALLERNNKLFTDDERKDLKQDLERTNKKANSLSDQLRAVKESVEFEELEKMRENVKQLNQKIKDLEAEVEELKNDDAKSEDSHTSGFRTLDSDTEGKLQDNKNRIELLERELQSLNEKLEDKDEELRDRDVMVDELQHRVQSLLENRKTDKENEKKLKSAEEEIRNLKSEIAQKNKTIQLYQSNLSGKDEQIERRDARIEELEKQLKLKNEEIKRLQEEISLLKRADVAMKRKCEDMESYIKRKSEQNSSRTSASSISSPERFRSPSLGRSTPKMSPVRSRNQSPAISNLSPKIKSSSQNSIDKKSDVGFTTASDVLNQSDEFITPKTTPVAQKPRGRSPTKRSKDGNETSQTEDTDSDARAVNVIRNMMREDIAEAKQKLDDMGQTLDSSPRASQRAFPLRKDGDLPDTLPTPQSTHDSSDSSNNDERETPKFKRRVFKGKASSSDSDSSENTMTEAKPETSSQSTIQSGSKVSSVGRKSKSPSPIRPVEHKGLKALSDLSASFHDDDLDINKVSVVLAQNEKPSIASSLKSKSSVHDSSDHSLSSHNNSKHSRSSSKNRSFIDKLFSKKDTPANSLHDTSDHSISSHNESKHSRSSSKNRSFTNKLRSKKNGEYEPSVSIHDSSDNSMSSLNDSKHSRSSIKKSERSVKKPARRGSGQSGPGDSQHSIGSKKKSPSVLSVKSFLDKLDAEKAEAKEEKSNKEKSDSNTSMSSAASSKKQTKILRRKKRSKKSDQSHDSSTDASEVLNKSVESEQHKKQEPLLNTSMDSTQPLMMGSLLPDDRTSLMEEIRKAREEAKMWWNEVTQNDREKRKSDRRVAELEDEMKRLKEIEDRYIKLKDKHDKIKKEWEKLSKSQEEKKTNSKPEFNEAVKAHLQDRQELAREDERIKQDLDDLIQSRISGIMGSQNQEKDNIKTPEKSPTRKPMQTSPPFLSANEREMNDLRNSMDYLSSNAKVNRLKQKCKERDIVLAKLLLKLRKPAHGKNNNVSMTDTLNSSFRDDASTTSSGSRLENLLDTASKMIHAPPTDSESDFFLSDFSEVERRNYLKAVQPDNPENNSYVSPPRPPVPVLRASTKSPQPHAQHRMCVVTQDHTPSANDQLSREGVAKLLPDLAVKKGDNAIAIGEPDQRNDGNMYQLAEVNGKIGFVPAKILSTVENNMNENVPEMSPAYAKALEMYEQDKRKRKNSSLRSSSTLICDSAKEKVKSPRRSRSRNRSVTEGSTTEDSTVVNEKRNKRKSSSRASSKHSKRSHSLTSDHSSRQGKPHDSDHSSVVSSNSDRNKTSPSGRGRKVESVSNSPEDKYASTKDYPPYRSRSLGIDKASPSPTRKSSMRTSTPLVNGDNGNNDTVYATPDTSFIPKFDNITSQTMTEPNSNNSSFQIPPGLPYSMPDPPTSIGIEKIMGRRSLILKWTPPALDVAARSNGVPVIGYDIYVNRERKLQISGAYSNKAIVGELNLDIPQYIEVCTVGTAGTQSDPVRVTCTANVPVSPRSASGSRIHTTASPENTLTRSHSEQRSPSHTLVNGKASKKLTNTTVRQATVKFAYNPETDSPYRETKHRDLRHTDNEIALEAGDSVIVIGEQRNDGFCEVQASGKSILTAANLSTSDNERTFS